MALAAPDVEYLKTVIAERSGNVISSNQDYLLESRWSPVQKPWGWTTSKHSLLNSGVGRQVSCMIAWRKPLTINETSFFRDISPFEALKSDVIPDLIRKRASTKTLNIWCGASSSGQEPYTIAMLLRENFNELAAWNVRILATDLSDDMVKTNS